MGVLVKREMKLTQPPQPQTAKRARLFECEANHGPSRDFTFRFWSSVVAAGQLNPCWLDRGLFFWGLNLTSFNNKRRLS